MDYFNRLKKSILYIEANLGEEISLADIAKPAGMSPYHFHRIFHLNIGLPPADYLRKRRLSQAALALMGGKGSILELALDCQYETHESFTRAFKREFGINPAQVRKKHKELELAGVPDISALKQSLKGKGRKEMEPKIVAKKAFDVIGVELATTTTDGRNFSEIPAFWDKYLQAKTEEKIPNKADPMVSYGICADFKEDGNFKYLIAFEATSLKDIPEGLVGRTIPAAKYAIFTAKGKLSDCIQDMMKYIYREWFPKSGKERADSPDLEAYDVRRMSKGSWEIDLYIPIE